MTDQERDERRLLHEGIEWALANADTHKAVVLLLELVTRLETELRGVSAEVWGEE